MIKLIVGLGNPGREYENTRHNAGFWFVDFLAKKLNCNFTLEGKFFGEVAKVKFNGNDLFLLKPQTYMNLSGKSIQALASFYKILPEEVLLVHDELDFKPGVSKLKQGGGNGGHNGLKDTDRVIGKNYWRLRIGIGHPGDSNKVAGYVLNNPTVDERIEIDRVLDKALGISNELIGGNFSIAQKILHTN